MNNVVESLRSAANDLGNGPKYCLLPPRLAVSVGREDEKQKVGSVLSLPRNGKRILIHGQSCVGKTLLLLEIAEGFAEGSDYHAIVWVECAQHNFYGGKSVPLVDAAVNVDEIVKKISHVVQAEAALRTTGKEAISALKARLAQLRTLIVIDGFDGIQSPECEDFVLNLPNTVDVVLTCRTNLLWQDSIHVEPWGENSSKAREFLNNLAHEKGWSFSSDEAKAVLKTGRGVPGGIFWCAHLLSKGVSIDHMQDLALGSWEALLDHFFEIQWKASFARKKFPRRAAAYLAYAGSVQKSNLEAITLGENQSGSNYSAEILVQSGFAKIQGDKLIPVPFAREFLRGKLQNSNQLITSFVESWIENLRERVGIANGLESWSEQFDAIRHFHEELLFGIDICLQRDELPSSLLDLVTAVTYYLYSCGNWDELQKLNPKILDLAAKERDHNAIVEIGLVWIVRVIRMRAGSEVASNFFEDWKMKVENTQDVTEDTMLCLQIAEESLKEPIQENGDLATSLASKSERLLELGNGEWACRGMLHSGNVWAELSAFELAETAYRKVAEFASDANPDRSEPWRNEMLGLSAVSLGVLSNREQNFEAAVDYIKTGISKQTQTADIATTYAEWSYAYARLGKRKLARRQLYRSIEHRNRLGIDSTVMESNPGWDLHDGPEGLFKRRGLERWNPWWKE